MTLTVFDWDEFSANDYEGEVNFKVGSLFREFPFKKNSYIMKTWELQNKKRQKHEVKGSLSLTLFVTSCMSTIFFCTYVPPFPPLTPT